jgi:hypothetical protein
MNGISPDLEIVHYHDFKIFGEITCQADVKALL